MSLLVHNEQMARPSDDPIRSGNMKDTIKVFDFVNIVKRLKNDEIKPNLFLLFVIYILSIILFVGFFVGFNMENCMVIQHVKNFTFVTLVLVLDFLIEAAEIYILTPRELTYKNVCIIAFSRFFICFIYYLLFMYICSFFPQLEQHLNVGLLIIKGYMLLQIKKLYCPPGFKRIYILIALFILSGLYYFRYDIFKLYIMLFK